MEDLKIKNTEYLENVVFTSKSFHTVITKIKENVTMFNKLLCKYTDHELTIFNYVLLILNADTKF